MRERGEGEKERRERKGEREKKGERREGKEEEEKQQQLLEFCLGCFSSGAVHLVFKF